MMRITGEKKQAYLDFASRVLEVPYSLESVKMISHVDENDNPVAVVLFTNSNQSNCEMSIATNGKWVASRQFISECFKYMFITCGFNRVTAVVEESNAKALEFNRRIGFKHEFDAPLRHWFGLNNHGIVLVMFKEECKWIRGVLCRAII